MLLSDDETWKIERYFLTDDPLLQREVTRKRYVEAERSAGFHPNGHDRGQPATGGFSSNGISGSSRIYFYKPVILAAEDDNVSECAHCTRWIVQVMESTYTTPTPVEIYRHWNDSYPHNIGPLECDLPPVQYVAAPAGRTLYPVDDDSEHW